MGGVLKVRWYEMTQRLEPVVDPFTESGHHGSANADDRSLFPGIFVDFVSNCFHAGFPSLVRFIHILECKTYDRTLYVKGL